MILGGKLFTVATRTIRPRAPQPVSLVAEVTSRRRSTRWWQATAGRRAKRRSMRGTKSTTPARLGGLEESELAVGGKSVRACWWLVSKERRAAAIIWVIDVTTLPEAPA